MIEANLAELVDDDRGARECGLAKQMAQQRRLAAAEEPGEKEDANHGGMTGAGVMRTWCRSYSESRAARTRRSTARSESAPRLRPFTVTIQRNGEPGGTGSTRISVALQDSKTTPPALADVPRQTPSCQTFRQ